MSRVRVSEALANVEGFVCDDCLMVLAGLGSRQAARRIAVLLASAGELSRGRGACSRCGKVKYVTSTSGRPAPHHEHGAGDATSVGVGSRADGPALAAALAAVQRLGVGAELTETIALLESAAVGHHHADISRLLHERGIDQDLLEGALLIKAVAGQIYIVVHAVGVLISLPHILESGEVVELLSLGAGNTGRDYDLETDRRIAEFKFITWRGGAEAIRQNHTFVDMFNLACADTTKRRVLYLLDADVPRRFFNGGRSIRSVLSHHEAVAQRFNERYGATYSVVRDWFAAECSAVEIVDLCTVVPGLALPGAETGGLQNDSDIASSDADPRSADWLSQ